MITRSCGRVINNNNNNNSPFEFFPRSNTHTLPQVARTHTSPQHTAIENNQIESIYPVLHARKASRHPATEFHETRHNDWVDFALKFNSIRTLLVANASLMVAAAAAAAARACESMPTV